jgi:K+-transporting ATPase KdpF subunit
VGSGRGKGSFDCNAARFANGIFAQDDRRNYQLGMNKTMDLQSLIMLIISALTAVYLFYALLRPEKF